VNLSIQCANPNTDSRIQWIHFWGGFTSETSLKQQYHKHKQITFTSLLTTPANADHSICQWIQIRIHYETESRFSQIEYGHNVIFLCRLSFYYYNSDICNYPFQFAYEVMAWLPDRIVNSLVLYAFGCSPSLQRNFTCCWAKMSHTFGRFLWPNFVICRNKHCNCASWSCWCWPGLADSHTLWSSLQPCVSRVLILDIRTVHSTYKHIGYKHAPVICTASCWSRLAPSHFNGKQLRL